MSSISSMNVSLIDALLEVDTGGIKQMTSFPPPDFTSFNFCTKTAPAMSEDEYREAIMEDAAQGICGGDSAGYRRLMKSYVSVVSPDRKGIIEKAAHHFASKRNIAFAECQNAPTKVLISNLHLTHFHLCLYKHRWKFLLFYLCVFAQ